MTATFQHKGVEITLGANGKFSAQTETGRIEAPSLDAIKKKLDKEPDFTPFKAFAIAGYSDLTLVDRTVTGVVKGRGRYGKDEWQTNWGKEPSVYVDTPENRANALAYIVMRKRHAEVRAQHEEEQRIARAAIVSRKPGDKVGAA